MSSVNGLGGNSPVQKIISNPIYRSVPTDPSKSSSATDKVELKSDCRVVGALLSRWLKMNSARPSGSGVSAVVWPRMPVERVGLHVFPPSAGVSAIVSGGTVNMSSAGDLQLTGGAAAGSQALILGGSTIDLHVGGLLALDGTSDNDSWARVQTATTSGQINLYFPSASSGGYFVDGFQRLKHGEDGFFTGDKPAKSGTSLFLHYGE